MPDLSAEVADWSTFICEQVPSTLTKVAVAAITKMIVTALTKSAVAAITKMIVTALNKSAVAASMRRLLTALMTTMTRTPRVVRTVAESVDLMRDLSQSAYETSQ